MLKPRGRLREIVLGSCPKCRSTNLVKLGKWDKNDGYKNQQRYRCNECRHLFPFGLLKDIPSFVFRVDEHNCCWEAYLPGYPVTPIMSGINRSGNLWNWNCYDIGEFSSRTELVKHYLSVKDSLIEYLQTKELSNV